MYTINQEVTPELLEDLGFVADAPTSPHYKLDLSEHNHLIFLKNNNINEWSVGLEYELPENSGAFTIKMAAQIQAESTVPMDDKSFPMNYNIVFLHTTITSRTELENLFIGLQIPYKVKMLQ